MFRMHTQMQTRHRGLRVILPLCLAASLAFGLGIAPATNAAPLPPLEPANLTAVHNGVNQVTFTWTDRSKNELVFGIQYHDYGSVTWRQFTSVPSTSSTATGKVYTVTRTVTTGIIFCFRVGAANLGGTRYGTERCAVPYRPTAVRATFASPQPDPCCRATINIGRSAKWEWGYRLYTRLPSQSSWTLLQQFRMIRPFPTQIVSKGYGDNRIHCFMIVAFNPKGTTYSNVICRFFPYYQEP
ncbi:UNVERIFIED_ORG: hypothetical protein J2X79_004220 [Arthrobacter globiformis]|nr:hypothetical protein [Arthrobacter globiformis]